MAKPRFRNDDFLKAALAIAAERGPSAVTIGSITERLRAPTGSFYHRFGSRGLLLATLWLRIMVDFQRGIGNALEAGDALLAALNAPSWARAHPNEARALLLYHRDEFVQGAWPEALRDALAAQTERTQADFATFARLAFGQVGRDELRQAQFLLAEVPVAAVTQHLRRREPPPRIVDELITITYRAVVAAYHANDAPQPPTGGQRLQLLRP